LKSGMTVILEKRELPVVSVAFAVRSGGINESEEERGISHFVEHLLYKGTKNRSREKIAEEIEKNGGVLNGFTAETMTAYWCKMPSMHLDLALDVLSDMVKNPLFKEEEVQKERKIIFEEINLHRDNPMRYSVEAAHSLLYEKPFGINLAGTKEILSKIDRQRILAWFKENYIPSNMILAVVGDADFEELVSFAEKNFKAEKISKKTNPPIRKRNGVKMESRKGVDQANLAFVYHVPLAGDKKSYAAEVLHSILSQGMSSRIFRQLREKRDLAYAIVGDSDINRDFAYNLIYVGTSKQNVEKVKEIILNEFKAVSESLTEKELAQTKEQMVGNYLISMEDSQDQMVNLLSFEINLDAKNFYEFEKNIRKVKLEDVKNLAKNTLKDYSFFGLLPCD